MAQPRVIFVANRGYALKSSRMSLICRFITSGWKVIVATADDSESREFGDLGTEREIISFDRGGLSAASDLFAFRKIAAIYRKWDPDIIHHFHAKPILFGTLAARLIPRISPKIINTVTGIGQAHAVSRVSAMLSSIGFRLAASRSDLTVFQNHDDLELFVSRGWISRSKARLIVSSGVDIRRFSVVDRQIGSCQPPVVVMLGRLLQQKGIAEFVDVAKRIRQSNPDVRFVLAGEEDAKHPNSVDMAWLLAQKSIEYVGHLSDVVPLLSEADVLLFPSYYREGVPRVVLEAAATALPTVAFDVPGVREAVRNEETGYLVPRRDIDTMTARVAVLLKDASLRYRMGMAARNMVERNFDLRAIEEQYVEIYRELGFEVA